MTRKIEGERRKFSRFHAQEGVFASYKSQTGQVLDIGMGGLAFCCPQKKSGAKGNGEDTAAFLTLSGKIHLEGLPVRVVNQSEITIDVDSSRKRKKLIRYGFEFGGLSPHQNMLLNHFIRIHSLEKCEFSALFC
jgi:hypothetical protein